uniref:Condensin complex subunit 1 C-terminal domain-containing protein n=1 Tax=Ciona savignyi TaxID=51511 RepID=H2ZHV5_CIOSA
MWEDWSSEVRKAASRTLGCTGHGRDVHFDLREKLGTGNERVCADVLRKIAHLGIMTATLLPEFIKCFSAEYVSVRLESCKTAAKLLIADERVVRELVQLTQYDPAWKIKAYAIKALGDIGMLTEKAESSLIWALRFEDEPGVRLEACVAIRKLNCRSSEVIHVLQDRVLVEPDATVKEEVRRTLDAFGMSGPEDNMEMIRQIKTEVQRLCKKSVVAAKVIMYEKELDKYERKAQYIGNMLDDMSEISSSDDVTPEINNVIFKSHDSSATRRNSLPRPPSITITPSADRPETRDKMSSRIDVVYEDDVPSPSAQRDTLTPNHDLKL